jgi:amino acid transporter
MKGTAESLFYVSVSVGMAMAMSSFTMIAGLFTAAGAPLVLVAVALGCAVCMVLALTVGELASMYPSSPGVWTYFRIAFGDRPSLVLVYLYLIFVVLIAGLESFVFAEVVSALLSNAPPMLTILVLIGSVAAINIAGLELPRNVQMLTTGLAVALIAVSGVWGIWQSTVPLSSVLSDWDKPGQLLMLPALAGMSVFLYTGFEWVTPLGLRPKAYEWKVPSSMPIAIVVLFFTCELFIVGAASQMSPAAIAATPTPQVPYFVALYGTVGLYLATFLSLMAVVSTFNAGILGGSRLICLLAQERSLPAWCGAVSLRSGCPIGAIGLLGTLAAISGIAVLLLRIEIPTALVGASTMCVIYGTLLIASVKLRKARPEARRLFRSPVSVYVQLMLATALFVMAAQTLFTEPTVWGRTVLGALMAIVVACVLALRSTLTGASAARRKTVETAP